jgi:hypothetical protein
MMSSKTHISTFPASLACLKTADPARARLFQSVSYANEKRPLSFSPPLIPTLEKRVIVSWEIRNLHVIEAAGRENISTARISL